MMLVSQSLIKDFFDYQESQQCGHVMRAKWGTKTWPDKPSRSMRAGSYFEYKVSGALPRNGEIPRPMCGLNGKPYADFAAAEVHAQQVAEDFKSMGLVIVHAGYYAEDGDHEGTIDLVMRATRKIVFDDGFVLKKGQLIIVDLKYSGLLDNTWSRHGWMWTEEQRKYHGIQAVHYHVLLKLPFFFYVKDSKTGDVKFFRVTITPEAIAAHKQLASDVGREMESLIMIDDFRPHPSYERCKDCALATGCPDKNVIRTAEEIII